MRKMTFLSAMISVGMLAACANTNSALSKSKPVSKTPAVLEMEQKKKAREEALQDMKDRNQVLNKKVQLQNPAAPASAPAASSLKLTARPQNKKIEIVEPKAALKMSDRELYAELVGAYDRNNEIAFYSRLQAFQAHYAQSSLADDALYLAGLMSLSNKNYGPSLRYLNQILKEHALSNKASAALFAKGVVLKKMNLLEDSKKAFVKVRKSYPGSPEALRAETELKLLTR